MAWRVPQVESRILVVGHGPGRGRQAEAARRILARATADVPWRRQLVQHETGASHLPRGREGALIVRPDLLHGQQSVHFCSTRAAAETAAAGMTGGAVIPFVDTRSGYARTRPGTIWHRLYHKKRAIVLGDEVVPNHVYFSSHPICGLKRSTFARYRRRWRWSWLAYFRPLERAALQVDDSFWRGPAEHPVLLQRAVQTLGLDFAAVDYSVGADGEPVLWEANPYFDLPDPARGAMPRERHLHHRIGGFDRAIGRFLAGFLAAGRVVPE